MDLTQLQLDTMKLPLRNKYIRLEILNYDFKVVDRIEGECVGGELSKDASSPIRRSGSVSIAIPTQYQAESIISELDGYDITVGGKVWLDKIVRVSIGVVNYLEKNSPTVWYRFGLCLIDTPSRNYTGQEYILSFNLLDYITILTSDRYGQLTGTKTVVEKGEYVTQTDGTIAYKRTPTQDALSAVIRDLAGLDKFVIYPIPKRWEYLPYDIKYDIGATVMDILNQFMEILSTWQMYMDNDGVLTIEPIPSGEEAPTIPIDESTLTSNTQEADFGNVKNQVVVYGRNNECTFFTGISESYIDINQPSDGYTYSLIVGENVYVYSTCERTATANPPIGIYSIKTGTKVGELEVPQDARGASIDLCYDTVDTLYLVGGSVNDKFFTYNINTKLWTRINDKIPTGYRFGCANSEGAMFYTGQRIQGGSYYTLIGTYNKSNGEWDNSTVRTIEVPTSAGGVRTFAVNSRQIACAINRLAVCSTYMLPQNDTEKEIKVAKNQSGGSVIRADEIHYTENYLVAVDSTTNNITILNADTLGHIADRTTMGSGTIVGQSSYFINQNSIANIGDTIYYYYRWVDPASVDAIIDKNIYAYDIKNNYFYIVGESTKYKPQQIGSVNDTVLLFAQYPLSTGKQETTAYRINKVTNLNCVNEEGNTLILKYDTLDIGKFTIKGTLFGFTKTNEYIGSPYNKIKIYNGDTPLSYTKGGITYDTFDLQYFENAIPYDKYYGAISNGFSLTQKYVAGSWAVWNNSLYECQQDCIGVYPTDIRYWENIQPKMQVDTTYIVRISEGTINNEQDSQFYGQVVINEKLKFEFVGKQEASYSLVNDNRESPYYVNSLIPTRNYYCGELQFNVKATTHTVCSYDVYLDDYDEEVTSLSDGDILTFMVPRGNNNWGSTTFEIYNSKHKKIKGFAPVVRDNKDVAKRSIQGSLVANYTIYKVRYDEANNQFVFLGRHDTALTLVKSGGEFDNLYADRLVYERCLYELYTHSNLNNRIALQAVPNYALDVNNKIPISQNAAKPYLQADVEYFMAKVPRTNVHEKIQTADGLIFITADSDELEGSKKINYLIKSITYPLGVENSATQNIVGCQIYDYGNLMGSDYR